MSHLRKYLAIIIVATHAFVHSQAIQSEWQRSTDQEAGFSISFPGRPTYEESTDPGTGQPLETYSFYYNGTLLRISFSPVIPAPKSALQINKILSDTAGLYATTAGTLLRQEKLQGGARQFDNLVKTQSGKYFVAAHQVPETKVKEAIEDSISKNQLHAGWRDWTGNGDLALAVRLDEGSVTPTLYTYLPMADDATAPFNGYLNAAFYAKLDRRRIEADITLNRLYFSQAFHLCARTILFIRHSISENGSVFSDSEVRTLIVDLLAWDESLKGQLGDAAKQLEEAFKNLGADLGDSPILPILGNGINAGPRRPAFYVGIVLCSHALRQNV